MFLIVAFDAMKDTVDAIKKASIRDMVKIIRGNINENIKNFAGADAYSMSRQGG